MLPKHVKDTDVRTQPFSTKYPIETAFPETTRCWSGTVAVALLALTTSPAHAIPSPDLVINMVASATQLLGLTTVLFGAGLAQKRLRGGTASRASQTGFYIVLALFLASAAGNIVQYSTAVDARNERLQTNLWRSSSEEGKKVGDVTLKTLALSEQTTHPLGISTERFQKMIDAGKPLNIIDVRESEEVEMGKVHGATASRYPDTQLNRHKLLKSGQENVLMCYSGNRSSELCIDFAREGLACKFVIGGFEKWVSEGRPLDADTDRADLRALPDFPNRDTLLDTSEVQELVQKRQAVFVDVRYPGDFNLGHLPGAVNIPVRKLTSPDLDKAVAALSADSPVIAPCYDKRSCFYASILGARVARQDRVFLGRYTVPHEYALPPKADPVYVQQWAESHQNTLAALAAKPFVAALGWLQGKTGSLVAAIALLVLALRLLVLPLTLKSDRDTLVMQQLKPRLAALKEKLRETPERLSRETLSLYAEHQLTPGRNFIGTAIQISLFMVIFSAVGQAAQRTEASFLWLGVLAKPDPAMALPLLVGALGFGLCLLAARAHSRLRLALYAAFGFGLVALTLTLSAAVNLYLVISLSLLVGQTLLVRRYLGRPLSAAVSTVTDAELAQRNVVELAQAHRVAQSGNKAGNLSRLSNAGYPVPPGFILTPRALHGDLQTMSGEILAMFDKLGLTNVAVRSSGAMEDGAQQSFAGIYESVLNVSRDELLAAIDTVRRSFSNERSKTYNSAGSDERPSGGIVIQQMVAAEYAGVLFTEHPRNAGRMLIEMVEGLGEKLVSGQAVPEMLEVGRGSGAVLEGASAAIDMAPLVTLGRRIENEYGAPQDIEWAYADGKFFILQTRAITTALTTQPSAHGAIERERVRLVDIAAHEGIGRDAVLLRQNELAELLPRPTPVSLSLMERLWEAGGATDLACQRLGLPYHVTDDKSAPYLVSVFGALYVNEHEGRRRFGQGAGARASFRLSREADVIATRFNDEFLPSYLSQMRLRHAVNLGNFNVAELADLLESWAEEFVERQYVEAEVINIAADFYLKTAERSLRKHGLDVSTYLGHGSETVLHKANAMMYEIKCGRREAHDLFDLFGFRAAHDYELSEPRYAEDSIRLQRVINASIASDQVSAGPDLGSLNKVARALVERARRYQTLKEDAKHHCMRALASLRTCLLELDRRLELDGKIFELRLDELKGITPADRDRLYLLASARAAMAEQWRTVALPASLSLAALEDMRVDENGIVATVAPLVSGAMAGQKVSGDHEVAGRVRVLRDEADLVDVQEGEIIVVRSLDPQWVPALPKVAGVVSEVGGWLSHMTIVAREYGTPTFIGVKEATQRLATGQHVTLCVSGMVDRRAADRRLQADRRVGRSRVGDNRRNSERRVRGRRAGD